MSGITSASQPFGGTNEDRIIERDEPFPEPPWRSNQPKPSDPITIEEAVSSWVREITRSRQKRTPKLARPGAIAAIGILAATIGVSLAGFQLLFAPAETSRNDNKGACSDSAAGPKSPCVASKSDGDSKLPVSPEKSAPLAPKLAGVGSPASSGLSTSNSPAKKTLPIQPKAAAPNSRTASMQREQSASRLTPAPETKPGTIEGWTVREVTGGTAVLDGPRGAWRVKRGDTLPGLGKVDSIVHWSSRWIVATSAGLVSTP